MFSSWAYILIGNNNTGKTSFQRNLVEELCGVHYKKLPRNIVKTISHPRTPRKLKTIFTSNRSYQELKREYKTVGDYFAKHFKGADICILSSHSDPASLSDVEEMIHHLKLRCYNVAGVFWSNGYDSGAETISLLPWQERLWIDNPPLAKKERVAAQLTSVAREFSELLIARSHWQ